MSPLKDKVDALEMALSLLPAKDQDFAKSLISGFVKNKSLSEKQVYWVDALLQRALAGDVVPAKKVIPLGSFSKVYSLFSKAQKSIKFPKLSLKGSNGSPIVLSLAGAKSKNPGIVNITDGGPYGSNRFYGSVFADGSYEQSYKNFPESKEVFAVLQALADNAEKVAGSYGKLSGYCCFCRKSLTGPQSVAVGYGPVCAQNWGLAQEYKQADSQSVNPDQLMLVDPA